MTNRAWKITYVTQSDFAKIKMYDTIKSGVNLPIAFQSWYSYVNPKLGYGCWTYTTQLECEIVG